MLQNSFSIIQIEISSLALSKHVEIQPEPFSSIERDLWRYALRVNQSIRRFQSLSIEENFQSSALRNELQTLENTPGSDNHQSWSTQFVLNNQTSHSARLNMLFVYQNKPKFCWLESKQIVVIGKLVAYNFDYEPILRNSLRTGFTIKDF